MAVKEGALPRARSTRRAVAWTGGGQVISFTTQVVTQVILAHLLTPREVGVYAVALATASLVSAIQSAGLNQLVVRAGDQRGLLETAFTVNAALSLTLAATIWGAGHLAAAIYGDPSVGEVMTVLAVPPLLGAVQFLPAAILQRDMRFDLIALVTTARVVTTAAVTVLLATRGFGPMSLGWGALAGALVTALLFCVVGRRHLSHRLRWREWRPVAAFGLQMIAIAGITVLSSRLADLVLGRLLGLAALGIYSRASGINAILWENIHAVLGRIFLSDFADRRRNGESLRPVYLRTLDMLTAVLWPAFAGMAVLARPLVRTVYGPNWTAAADPLSFLAVSSIVLISVSMTWEVFVVCGRTGQQAKIEARRNLIGLAAFCVGCLVSIGGAAMARVIDALVSVSLYRRPLAAMTETSLADVLPIFRRSALLTGAAVAPSAYLMTWYGWSYDVPVAAIVAGIGSGCLTWMIGLRLTRHSLLTEINLVGTKVLARWHPAL